MGWLRGSFDDDDDLLEPLDPDTLEPLDPDAVLDAGVGREHTGISVFSRPHRKQRVVGRRAFRLYVLAGALGMLSLLQLVSAVHVRNVERDLRGIEELWRTAVVVDGDRGEAEAAVEDVSRQFGHTRSLAEQRRDVLDAENARLEKIERELANLRVSTRVARRLRDEMHDALRVRRVQLDRRFVPHDDAAFAQVTRELAVALDGWRLDEEHPSDVALTAADETIERLSHFADEPTGLVIAAVSPKGLHVIDVDNDRVGTHAIGVDILFHADVHSLGDVVVVHANDVARAVRIRSVDDVVELWQRPAVAVTTDDDGHLWLQHDQRLERLDADGNRASRGAIELGIGGGWLVDAVGADALVVTADGDYRSIAPDGGPGVDLTAPRVLDDDDRTVWGTAHGNWVVGLSDGHIAVARLDGERLRPSRLRAPLPRLRGLAVVDV